MNGEAAVLRPEMAAAETGALLAVSVQVLAELEETRRLVRMAIAAHPDATALVASEMRLADLQGEYRLGTERNRQSAAMRNAFDLIAANPAPPLAAVPVPRRGRHRSRQRAPGGRPLMAAVQVLAR